MVAALQEVIEAQNAQWRAIDKLNTDYVSCTGEILTRHENLAKLIKDTKTLVIATVGAALDTKLNVRTNFKISCHFAHKLDRVY